MPAVYFGVVHDSGLVKRRYDTDDDADDSHLDLAEAAMKPGEVMLRLPIADYPRAARRNPTILTLATAKGHFQP